MRMMKMKMKIHIASKVGPFEMPQRLHTSPSPTATSTRRVGVSAAATFHGER